MPRLQVQVLFVQVLSSLHLVTGNPSISVFVSTVELGRFLVLEVSELPSPASEGPSHLSVLGAMPLFGHSMMALTIWTPECRHKMDRKGCQGSSWVDLISRE